MRAIVQGAYGSTDTLELRDIDQPEIGDRDVLIHVHAAGVDRGVWHLMTGRPYLIRLAYGLRRPKFPVPGSDVAGRVEAVGANVTRFRPGDEVIGIGEGTFAEYAAVREDKLALKPVNLTFEQSAAVPISATMCWSSARRVGWGRSPSSSPRRSARTSRAGARRPRWTWSARSALSTSSTTPARTSATRSVGTTSSSTAVAGVRYRTCVARSPHEAGS